MENEFVQKILTKCFFKSISDQRCSHVETSQLICNSNQLTGFYRRVAKS